MDTRAIGQLVCVLGRVSPVAAWVGDWVACMVVGLLRLIATLTHSGLAIHASIWYTSISYFS
jgi:hypothetical protein